MEEQGGHENPLQFMSLNFGGNANDVSYGPADDLKQHFVMGAERIGKQPNDLPLPQWIHCQKPNLNYVEFLAENSTFLEQASPADMLECIASPVGSTLVVDGISEFQRELLYNDSGRACGFKPADSSLDMDAWKDKPFSYMLNNDNHEFQRELLYNDPGRGCVSKPADSSLDMNAWKVKLSSYMLNNDNHEASVRFLNPHNEGEPVNKFTSSEYQTYAQNHTLWTQEPNEDNCNVSQLQPRVSAAVPGFFSKPASRLSTDRCRRLRISERLKALQELLPHSVEGNQASAFDDVINHIKYLQLQIKELSRSRLGGEPTSSPFILLEGYGHYFLHEQTMNEPLEMMMGKLLEINPIAATQLLESRGLYMMPMALAEVLRQVI